MFDKLRHDPPGERFVRHHERLEKESPALRIGIAIVGILLVLGGGLLLILPGPGIPLVILGLASLSGLSKSLARALDVAEPAVRRLFHRLKTWWQRRGTGAKGLLVAAAALVIGGAGLGVAMTVL